MKGILMACSLLAGCGSEVAIDKNAPAQGARDMSVVVFIGDSITYHWRPLPIAGAIDAGVPGQISKQVAARFQTDAVDTVAGTVVILAGTNDMLEGLQVDPVYVEQMALEARDAGMDVVICTLPPTTKDQATTARVTEFNEELYEFALTNKVVVADYYTAMVGRPGMFIDGVHPSKAGYAVMWGVLEEAFEEND
jgi:lysophospholipase L1-like esterase